MLDIDFIRENKEEVKKACKAKQEDVDIDKLLELDEKRRSLKTKVDEMRHDQNKLTKKVEQAEEDEREEIIEEIKPLKKKLQKKEDEWKEVKKKWKDLMLQVPNIPVSKVPEGESEEDNVVIDQWGDKPDFDFEPKDHLEIGRNLNLIDVERAAKVSGSRFAYLKNEAVLLQFALVNLSLAYLLEKDFTPVLPPVMLRPDAMEGLGYLEQGEDDMYFLEKDELFLAGTAEHPLAAMHSGEVLDGEDLPLRYVAFSPSFRREAGSYGKDTRGIFRVHQFNKVEMFSICKPENSTDEHQFFLDLEQQLMQLLGIPYQVVQMCTADLGHPVANKYDIETWMPSYNDYRETHSTSNCTDFQARRLNIQYEEDGEKKLVHTVNGTGFALGRTLIAILENYQKEDGSIEVPSALQDYLEFE
ncbi:MAG: serine--tRNA ligase [Candidatus Paceibacterota bacterium]